MFDDAKIDVPCPSCGKETSKTISWLKSHKEITCGRCNTTFEVDTTKFEKDLRAAEKQVADFKRKMSRLFK